MSLESISDYINSLEESAKADVSEFISFMNLEFPHIIPRISFSMPMWWLGPKMYDGYVAVSAA